MNIRGHACWFDIKDFFVTATRSNIPLKQQQIANNSSHNAAGFSIV